MCPPMCWSTCLVLTALPMTRRRLRRALSRLSEFWQITIQIAITAIGGWLGYFLGGIDGLMIALMIFMALDYVTGVMCAIIDKKLSSAVGFKGVCKKVLILFMVGIANIVDLHVIGSGSALRGAVIAFYLSNEGLSLLENAAYIGLRIPDKLKAVLEQLHNRDEKEGKDDQGDGE